MSMIQYTLEMFIDKIEYQDKCHGKTHKIEHTTDFGVAWTNRQTLFLKKFRLK